MIIDLRYHIASLVAVFLALGLGILVGGVMLKSDTLIAQQKQMTDKLERKLEQLRRNNEAMQVQINSLQIDSNTQREFEKRILPYLVQGRLEGYHVAIIETNGFGFPDDLITTLKTAGAKVESITTILNGFRGVANKDIAEKRLGWENVNENQVEVKLAQEVARGVLAGDNPQVLNFLTEINALKTSGEYGVPLNGIIIIGGSQEREMVKIDTIDLPIISYFLEKGVSVYGVEETEVIYSYMKEYQRKKISTVDNIDSIPGQFALVLAMAGKPGHYGVKSTAQELLPALDNPGGNNGV